MKECKSRKETNAMNNKVIKLISIGASFIGAAAAVVGSWATAKQTDEKIREAVIEEVAKALSKES